MTKNGLEVKLDTSSGEANGEAPNCSPGARPLSIAMIGLRGIPASYGEVERAVEELSATLVERGHRVTVFARNAYSDRSIKEDRNIEVRHLSQRPLRPSTTT
jgi:hypothetical protein